jgi:hypothetical protein
MRRLGGISIVGVAAAAAAATGLSAHATSAAPLPTKSTVDVTYSCPVQRAKVVNIYAGTALPAAHNNPSPGALGFDTGIKTKTVGGTTTTRTQASVTAQTTNGVLIDKKACTKLKKPIAFSKKKLPLLVTATTKFRGYTSQACDSTRKVVFRLQVHLTGGKPTSAEFAVRNAGAKGKPIALVNWSPKKVSAHFSLGCTPPG